MEVEVMIIEIFMYLLWRINKLFVEFVECFF